MAEKNETVELPKPELVVMQAIHAKLREHTDTMSLCQTMATQKLRIDAALTVISSMRARLKQAEDELLTIRHGHKTTRMGD